MKSGMAGPDADLMAPIERIARFMETLDARALDGAFAARDVVIVENFPPYVFQGDDAVPRWAEGFAEHAMNISGLRHSFGAPHDFQSDGDTAFLSLPTTWRGTTGGRSFTETGGWAFVLVKQPDGWRVRSYGWAVTGIEIEAH
jgi:hypothetical protein